MKKTVQLVLRIPPDQKRALAQIKRRKGLTFNAQVQQAIARWIKEAK
jgi:hypothetical protein